MTVGIGALRRRCQGRRAETHAHILPPRSSLPETSTRASYLKSPNNPTENPTRLSHSTPPFGSRYTNFDATRDQIGVLLGWFRSAGLAVSDDLGVRYDEGGVLSL